MKIILLETATTKLDDDLKIGTAKYYFNNCCKEKPYKKWMPENNIGRLLYNNKLKLYPIVHTMIKIMREQFSTFDGIVQYCGGEGAEFITHKLLKQDSCIYKIEIIPILEDANIIISVYAKNKFLFIEGGQTNV